MEISLKPSSNLHHLKLEFLIDIMNCKDAISLSNNKVILKLHVIPGSFQSVFPAGYNKWRNCIEIKVKAEARENKANNEVIEKIAEFLNVSPKDIFVISGQKSKEKTVSVKNVRIDEICDKIKESLNGL